MLGFPGAKQLGQNVGAGVVLATGDVVSGVTGAVDEDAKERAERRFSEFADKIQGVEEQKKSGGMLGAVSEGSEDSSDTSSTDSDEDGGSDGSDSDESGDSGGIGGAGAGVGVELAGVRGCVLIRGTPIPSPCALFVGDHR